MRATKIPSSAPAMSSAGGLIGGHLNGKSGQQLAGGRLGQGMAIRENDRRNAAVPMVDFFDGCPRGSWDPDGRWGHEGGRIYATALAVLTLEVYYRYANPGDALEPSTRGAPESPFPPQPASASVATTPRRPIQLSMSNEYRDCASCSSV